MSNMKKNIIMRSAVILLIVSSALMSSCGGGRYHDRPFGGMNGRVQKVTLFHLMPEMWYAGNVGTDIMYTNTTVYDLEGNEICSALIDSGGYIQVETENLFENGVSVRSVQKSGGKTLVHMNLVSDNKKGVLEYNKEMNGHMVRMVVKKSSLGRRHKSVVSEDGKVIMTSVIKTDRKGYPVRITTKDAVKGVVTVELNTLDDKHNVIEKHVTTDDGKPERITFIEYGGFDEYGNWLDARTYNDLRLPEEVLVREIEYW